MKAFPLKPAVHGYNNQEMLLPHGAARAVVLCVFLAAFSTHYVSAQNSPDDKLRLADSLQDNGSLRESREIYESLVNDLSAVGPSRELGHALNGLSNIDAAEGDVIQVQYRAGADGDGDDPATARRACGRALSFARKMRRAERGRHRRTDRGAGCATARKRRSNTAGDAGPGAARRATTSTRPPCRTPDAQDWSL